MSIRQPQKPIPGGRRSREPLPHRAYYITHILAKDIYIITATPYGPALRTYTTMKSAREAINKMARQAKMQAAARAFGCEITNTAPSAGTWLDKYRQASSPDGSGQDKDGGAR